MIKSCLKTEAKQRLRRWCRRLAAAAGPSRAACRAVSRCRCCPAQLPPGVPAEQETLVSLLCRACTNTVYLSGRAGQNCSCLLLRRRRQQQQRERQERPWRVCAFCVLTSHGLFRLVGVECSLSHFLIFSLPCMLTLPLCSLCLFCPVCKLCVGGVTGNPQVEGTEGTEGRAP